MPLPRDCPSHEFAKTGAQLVILEFVENVARQFFSRQVKCRVVTGSSRDGYFGGSVALSVTGTDLKAGVRDRGSDERGTRMLHSG